MRGVVVDPRGKSGYQASGMATDAQGFWSAERGWSRPPPPPRAQPIPTRPVDHGENAACALAASLRRVADSGRTTVDFEWHDVDPHYGPLAAPLPALSADPLYLLKVDQRRISRH